MPDSHIPPLRFHALTPAYDAVVRWTSAEEAFRGAMLEALAAHSPARVLDVGCGTGTFAVALKRALLGAQVAGVDADEAALRIAANKCEREGVEVELRQCDARSLPFEAQSFDAAAASLFFHHLEDGDKRKVLGELHRCVKPAGALVVADWHRADGALRRLAFSAVRALDGYAVTRMHALGRFPQLLAESGFEVLGETCVPAPLGAVGVWCCRRL